MCFLWTKLCLLKIANLRNYEAFLRSNGFNKNNSINSLLPKTWYNKDWTVFAWVLLNLINSLFIIWMLKPLIQNFLVFHSQNFLIFCSKTCTEYRAVQVQLSVEYKPNIISIIYKPAANQMTGSHMIETLNIQNEITGSIKLNWELRKINPWRINVCFI